MSRTLKGKKGIGSQRARRPRAGPAPGGNRGRGRGCSRGRQAGFGGQILQTQGVVIMSEKDEAKARRETSVRGGNECGERDPFSPRRCILPAGHEGLHRDTEERESAFVAPHERLREKATALPPGELLRRFDEIGDSVPMTDEDAEETLEEAGLSEREVRASLERLLGRIAVTLDDPGPRR
jgi:hypothetical protein